MNLSFGVNLTSEDQESESYTTYLTLIVQIAILAISRQTATVEITVLHLRNFHLGEATAITAPW